MHSVRTHLLIKEGCYQETTLNAISAPLNTINTSLPDTDKPFYILPIPFPL